MQRKGTKRCPRCGLEKTFDSFNWRDAAHTKIQSFCQECSNEAWRDWYRVEENRQHHLELVAARRKRRRTRHGVMINELKEQPCADCGKTFPYYVMDFDHLGEKSANVSSLKGNFGTDRLESELAKCEIRLLELSSNENLQATERAMSKRLVRH